MIFHIFSIPFLPWVFHRRLFKVLRKKNEIHCKQEWTAVRQWTSSSTRPPAWPKPSAATTQASSSFGKNTTAVSESSFDRFFSTSRNLLSTASTSKVVCPTSRSSQISELNRAEEEAKEMVDTICVFRWMEVLFSRVIPDPCWPRSTRGIQNSVEYSVRAKYSANTLRVLCRILCPRVNVPSSRPSCSACHPPLDFDDSFRKICVPSSIVSWGEFRAKKDHCWQRKCTQLKGVVLSLFENHFRCPWKIQDQRDLERGLITISQTHRLTLTLPATKCVHFQKMRLFPSSDNQNSFYLISTPLQRFSSVQFRSACFL